MVKTVNLERPAIFRLTVRPSGERLGEEGFTLIEVIAALAILSLSLAVLFSTLSQSFYDQGRAKTLSDATMLAQSMLARVGPELPIQPGETGGALKNGYRWTVGIAAYGAPADQQEWPIAAFRISVAIFGSEASRDPVITLTTLRLAAKGSSQ